MKKIIPFIIILFLLTIEYLPIGEIRAFTKIFTWFSPFYYPIIISFILFILVIVKRSYKYLFLFIFSVSLLVFRHKIQECCFYITYKFNKDNVKTEDITTVFTGIEKKIYYTAKHIPIIELKWHSILNEDHRLIKSTKINYNDYANSDGPEIIKCIDSSWHIIYTPFLE